MKQLDKLELRYDVIDVTLDRAAEKDVRNMEIDGKPVMQLPVVIVSNSKRTVRWSGFRLEKIRGLRETGDY
jgi:glutaredoxin